MLGRESVIKWAPPTTTQPHAQPVVRPPTVSSPYRHPEDTPIPPTLTSSTVTRTPAIAIQIPSPAAQPIANRPDTRSPPVTEEPARSCSPPPPLQCGPHTENSRRNIKRKKTRMDKVNTPGFIELWVPRRRSEGGTVRFVRTVRHTESSRHFSRLGDRGRCGRAFCPRCHRCGRQNM